MEKVKLTKEQEIAIIHGKANLSWENDNFVFSHCNDSFPHKLSSLADLKLDDLIRALYIGYEVDPKFNVGDWVHVSWNDDKPSVHKVIKTGVRSIYGNKNGIEIDWDRNPRPSLDIIRHATPEEIVEEKERRFFHRHGREPWKLKGKDLIADTMDGLLEIIKETDSRNGYWAYSFFGHNNYVIGKAELLVGGLTGRFEVACFAEDRKDVDNE